MTADDFRAALLARDFDRARQILCALDEALAVEVVEGLDEATRAAWITDAVEGAREIGRLRRWRDVAAAGIGFVRLAEIEAAADAEVREIEAACLLRLQDRGQSN